jgi:hypothetical protein
MSNGEQRDLFGRVNDKLALLLSLISFLCIVFGGGAAYQRVLNGQETLSLKMDALTVLMNTRVTDLAGRVDRLERRLDK